MKNYEGTLFDEIYILIPYGPYTAIVSVLFQDAVRTVIAREKLQQNTALLNKMNLLSWTYL